MKEQHLRRTNKLLFSLYLLITVFGVIGLLSQFAMSDLAPWQSIFPLLVTIVGFAVAVFIFVRKRTTVFFDRSLAVIYTIVYAVMMLTTTSSTAYPYMIPIITLLVISLDKMSVRIAGVSFIVINFLHVILATSQASDISLVIESIMIEVIISISVAVGALMGIIILNRFMEDSVKEITQAAEKQTQLIEQIMAVAKKIESETGECRDSIRYIKESAGAINSAMNDISNGTTDTAEAIQQQNEMTQNITDIISQTSEMTAEMSDLSGKTMDALGSGTGAMRTLLDQVEVAIVSGKEMKDSAEKLQGMTKEVRDIISIILSISSQTNLLALNASIEAARAGEAGRGFAVVADEIRNLADQTKDSTEKISTILDELTKDSQHVVDKVEESVELSAKQTTLAEIANKEFNHIKEMVEKVITDMEEIDRKIQRLTSANKVISENVTTLSASTQEISASTVNTYEESQKNVELVDGFENALQVILDEIYDLSKIR